MAWVESATGEQVRISFEFFPPKTPELEGQLWQEVQVLKAWRPDFVSVTYGAGGSTRDTTLSTVSRLISEAGLPTASHLTCVGATRETVDETVRTFEAAGVRHFLALRGDPQGGVGSRYVPHPGGYANAAELAHGLRGLGDFEISVSAYPEKHPESADTRADIDMLKRKVDAGAVRAITQFFFDNDCFARYLDAVRSAGITIPIVPGILPVHNLGQVRKFASLCGTSIPAVLDELLGPVDANPIERPKRAVEFAARQVEGLRALGIEEFHFYTMNRSQLVSAVIDQAGLRRVVVPARRAAVA